MTSCRSALAIALSLAALTGLACQAADRPSSSATARTATSTAMRDQPPPELTQPVNDFAGVIDADDERTLDRIIRSLQAASGDVIVVATVKTYQPAGDIRMYANEMFENHGKGIGQKGRDNGLLVVLAVDDREVWSEVGYDLEGIITDGFAGETSRQTMVPHFRRGDYGEGLVQGVSVYARRIAEARKVTLDNVPLAEPPPSTGPGFEIGIVPIVIFLIILANVARLARTALFGGRRLRRRRWGSMVGPFGPGYGGWHGGRGGGWGGGGSFGGGFGGFGGGRSGGGGGGASW